MAQLRLVTEIASEYGVEIPFADVVNVTSLWEFLRRINGEAVKKVVAVDLDNTLWEGVVGEDGVDGIRPNLPLQRELKALKDRGVLLVILSKNNEKDALEGLDKQPILSRDDFVTWRINWEPKAANLISIAEEMNLGVDSFVFVDDNPVERLRMSAYLPQVTVADFPPKLAAYFPQRPLTEEDLRKTEEYRAEATRKTFLSNIEEKDPLRVRRALELVLDVHLMKPDEVPRVAQLSQKANQFDVCTNRYAEEKIRQLLRDDPRVSRRKRPYNEVETDFVLTVHAKDKFGDYGLVGFVIVTGGVIVDWVMSCRVMGRGIEDRVKVELERMAIQCGLKKLYARWCDSGKNSPVKELYDRLGFDLIRQSHDARSYRLILGAKSAEADVRAGKASRRACIDRKAALVVLASKRDGCKRFMGKKYVAKKVCVKSLGKTAAVRKDAIPKGKALKAAAAFA